PRVFLDAPTVARSGRDVGSLRLPRPPDRGFLDESSGRFDRAVQHDHVFEFASRPGKHGAAICKALLAQSPAVAAPGSGRPESRSDRAPVRDASLPRAHLCLFRYGNWVGAPTREARAV